MTTHEPPSNDESNGPPQAATPASFTHEVALQREARLSYRVHVGSELSALRTEVLRANVEAGNAVLVSDTELERHGHVAAVAAELGLAEHCVYVLPSGEAHKTPETLLALVRWALQTGLERGGTWIALGGGVVCDLTGLAAALYMRGTEVVHLPTSLLAMVDAAIGGKTGVDLAEGKNLLGVIHQPRAVIADIAHLRTLPAQEISHGLAEMLKHGWIADADLLAELEALPRREALQEPAHAARSAELVSRAVAVKVKLVSEDEAEQRGPRMLLNFGHTVGHALEAATQYDVPHGTAVAIGMVAETHIANELGICQEPHAVARLRTALNRLGLPSSAAPRWIEPSLAALRHDKKRRDGKLRMALPQTPGEATLIDNVPQETVKAALRILWQE